MRPPVVPAPDRVEDLGSGLGPRWLDEYLRNGLAELVEIRRRVHAHPELGHRESATTAMIMRLLDADGIKAAVMPSGTGVIAEIGTGERVVGLRADIDALPIREATGLPYSSTLPDVSHACGHDLHLTVLLGAARALHRGGDIGGRVRLIFQPAEEVFPGGSHDVIAAGGLDGLSRLYALHCDPRLRVGLVGLKAGPITSTADQIELRILGPGGHTSRPHLTTDLVYALAPAASWFLAASWLLGPVRLWPTTPVPRVADGGCLSCCGTIRGLPAALFAHGVSGDLAEREPLRERWTAVAAWCVVPSPN